MDDLTGCYHEGQRASVDTDNERWLSARDAGRVCGLVGPCTSALLSLDSYQASKALSCTIWSPAGCSMPYFSQCEFFLFHLCFQPQGVRGLGGKRV